MRNAAIWSVHACALCRWSRRQLYKTRLLQHVYVLPHLMCKMTQTSQVVFDWSSLISHFQPVAGHCNNVTKPRGFSFTAIVQQQWRKAKIQKCLGQAAWSTTACLVVVVLWKCSGRHFQYTGSNHSCFVLRDFLISQFETILFHTAHHQWQLWH